MNLLTYLILIINAHVKLRIYEGHKQIIIGKFSKNSCNLKMIILYFVLFFNIHYL